MLFKVVALSKHQVEKRMNIFTEKPPRGTSDPTEKRVVVQNRLL